MEQNKFDILTEEEKNLEFKRKSRHRLFIAFLILDIALMGYLVYAAIFFFTHLN